MRQPCRSAYRLYMRNRSATKSAASSPPVPARISRMTFFSSLGSLGINRILSSCSSASRRLSSVFSSSRASSRISASLPSTSSWAPLIPSSTPLYSRNFCTSVSSSDSVFADRRYSAASACTSAVPSFVISSSYLFSTLRSLSNIALLSRPYGSTSRNRRHERDLVALMHLGGHASVFRVDRDRHRLFVLAQRRPLKDEVVPNLPCRGMRRHFANQLAAARQIAQPRKQAHGYAHAVRYAFSRAAWSSGSAVAPSSQTSPPLKCSRFQIGTICLTRSIVYRHAANASARWADAAAITILASPISSRPRR